MATVQASVTQFQVEEKAEGEYKVEQVLPQDSGPSLHSGNRQEINFEAGPIKVSTRSPLSSTSIATVD
jgi:hypothetical protein